jgi:hypothetical protein
MSDSKSLMVYQDEPASGQFLKLITIGVPAALLALSLYLWTSAKSPGSLVLLVEAFVIGLILWTVIPRRYQVYEDHLRIVLGGPFSFNIGFDQIKAIEITSSAAISVNFVTRVTRTYVRIVRRRGLSVAITPRSNAMFVESANRAASQWAKTGKLNV